MTDPHKTPDAEPFAASGAGNGETDRDPGREPETETAAAPESAPSPAFGDAPPPPEGAAPPLPEVRIAELEAEVESLRDKALRAMAEVENTRRRAQRDKDDAFKYAITGFAREMLTVADNLHRAIASVDAEARESDGPLKVLLEGVEMTERAMLAAFERAAIRRIEATGRRFDHNLHEAMFEAEDPSQPAGTVLQELEAGYLLNDRLLRPAKVMVSKGGPPPGAQAPAGGAEGAAEAGDAAGAGKGGARAYEKPSSKSSGGQIDENL